MAGYVMRQFTCPKAVTHPITNRARCRATALIETNAFLPLHQTARRTALRGCVSFKSRDKFTVEQHGQKVNVQAWQQSITGVEMHRIPSSGTLNSTIPYLHFNAVFGGGPG